MLRPRAHATTSAALDPIAEDEAFLRTRAPLRATRTRGSSPERTPPPPGAPIRLACHLERQLLLGRLRKDLDKSSFFAYVEEKDPDVICLQETWLPAAGPDRCARPRTAPARPVHDVGTHHPTPSLILGTLTSCSPLSLRSRGVLRDDTKTYREDKQLIDLVMRQKPLSKYRAYWSCADIKRAGSGVLVKKDIDVVSVRRSLTSPGNPTRKAASSSLSSPTRCS